MEIVKQLQKKFICNFSKYFFLGRIGPIVQTFGSPSPGCSHKRFVHRPFTRNASSSRRN